MTIRPWIALLALGAAGTASGEPAPARHGYWLFESGQVRPLELSPSGSWLYAVNTPDNRLEIFHVEASGLTPVASVTVGLEPVAVSARSETEVWVVNHLSDSVSVVDLSLPVAPRVVRTLLVGDEPRDVVFAGPSRARAFVTTAHRGQNVPYDPQLTTPGVGRADVWVFDADRPAAGPLTIINLFTDTPRSLAVTPDGKTVYAAGFHTGNQTTTVTEFVQTPETAPPALVDHTGAAQPIAGIIARFDGTSWRDAAGRIWDAVVSFNLPDKDVFAIDAMASPPAKVADFAHVGTILYNMAVNPVNGHVYVSNTEAHNEERFEGPGLFTGHSVRGRHNQNRITVIAGGAATPRHLNKHIDYSSCCAPVPNAENALSVALPTGLAVSGDGKTLYAAMLGSSKVAVYDTQALENDTFQPSAAGQIALSGGGPTGLVLDKRGERLFVMTRFDNAVTTVDLKTRREVGKNRLFNPEPASVVRGRPFLYDARLSSHGDSACATCHVFGDNDDLAWDLGNPDGEYAANRNPIFRNLQPAPADPAFAPMKGAMTTQSLRGLANHGPMHWRGDRTGSKTAPNAQPASGAFDEREAFRQFQAGFTDLLGTPGPLADADMSAFTDFILQEVYPPNPNRNLDDSLTSDQEEGLSFFMDRVAESGVGQPSLGTCESCHRLDPSANPGEPFPGFFGTDGQSARVFTSQVMKIPHLRNLYTKVGRFGQPDLYPFFEHIAGQDGFLGDQIRGFGVTHSGDTDSVLRFVGGAAFRTDFPFAPNPGGTLPGEAGRPEREKLASFLFAFPTNLKPIVGQQITLRSDNAAAVAPRIDLLVARADAGDCDLVVKAQLLVFQRGWLYVGGGRFRPDTRLLPTVDQVTLRKLVTAPFQSLTFTCVPPGSGYRIGIDRDEDGILDGDDATR